MRTKQRLFWAEQKKMKRRFVWLVPIGFAALLMLWSMANIRNFTDADRAFGYAYLFYSYCVMNAIFMPVMLAVVASRLCDMEIKGNTWKLLYTMEKPGSFYDIKFFFECRYLVCFTAAETLGILLFGKLFGFTEPVQAGRFLLHFLAITAVGAVLLGIQHLLSLMSDNQIIPLLVGIAGGFLGLFSMYFPRIVNQLVIWGYFSIFSVAAVDWEKTANGGMALYYVDFPEVQFAVFLLAGAGLYLAERWIYLRKEV